MRVKLLSLLVASILSITFNPAADAKQLSKAESTKAAVAKGSALMQQKKYKEAQALFKSACAKDPRNKVLQYYLLDVGESIM